MTDIISPPPKMSDNESVPPSTELVTANQKIMMTKLNSDCPDEHRNILRQLRRELPDQQDLWVECFRVLNVGPTNRLPVDAHTYPDNLRRLAVYKPAYRTELNKVATFIEQRLEIYYTVEGMSKEAACYKQFKEKTQEMTVSVNPSTEDVAPDSTAHFEAQSEPEQLDALTITNKSDLVNYLTKLGYNIPSCETNDEWIYILKLGGDNYYVGKTRNLLRRLLAQLRGTNESHAWVREHKVTRVMTIIESPYVGYEQIVTEEYASRYGKNKVRGAKCARTYVACHKTGENAPSSAAASSSLHALGWV